MRIISLTVFLLFLSMCLTSAFVLYKKVYTENSRANENLSQASQLPESKLSHLQQEGPEYWSQLALQSIAEKRHEFKNERKAKNIVLFLGDGMSLPTITAARIFKGQLQNLPFGEDAVLSFETFPYSGISKTYCTDVQIADSACTATAYLCGVKNNVGTIGVTANVTLGNCEAQMSPENQVSSILAWAIAAGKSTGIVTTTRVTHATPAGTYAHIANRDWEDDGKVSADGKNSDSCDDIAEQLILREPGKNINVILGGGRAEFYGSTETDPQSGLKGYRLDGNNLINEWQNRNRNRNGEYIVTRDQLLNLNVTSTDFLLGLFAPSHLELVENQIAYNQPTLEEMTRVAIGILGKNPKGFFLLVEGGNIDIAHHQGYAKRALIETVEFDKAITKAKSMLSNLDTIMVVTSDHSHTMTIAGYPKRGNPILGIGGTSEIDKMPYTTLSYANGPGYKNGSANGERYNISNDKTEDLNYRQISTVPLGYETHGGDDVMIYANGPFAHYFSGVHQQSDIPHILAYSACISPNPAFRGPHCKR